MRGTRKLQFAGELIEEVAENVGDDGLQADLEALSEEVDEARKPLFQIRVAEEMTGEVTHTSTSHTEDTSGTRHP